MLRVAGKTHYDWERFWVSAERRIEIDSDAFFPDPRSEYSWLRPSVEARTLEELLNEPCLILLGEPGLGKSQAVEDAVASAPADLLVEHINLAAYPDASALRSKLLAGEAWRKWATDGRPLHLYLDSFDEATLSFPSIPKFLIEELRGVSDSLDTLHLRITCRSAEWITEVADGLREIWPSEERGGNPVHELTLTPLRERDVRAAATADGLDGDQLLAEIRDHDVEGLAALPLTLRMMLEAAKEGAGLPDSQAELYQLGVVHLLNEPDPIRRRGEAPRRMEIGERLAVAERVSAAVLLSQRSGVSLQPGHAGPGDVDPAEIAGFQESDRLAAGGDRFDVGGAEILETLRTALFSIFGAERVSFAHRSLGEYCAGAFLANVALDRNALSKLLFAASDSEGRLVPQLREVAAWAAALDPNALEMVLESEAEVLLRIDRLALDSEQRAQVVAAILNVEPAERISRWDRRIWESLRALDHAGLPDQLNPLIRDRDANWSVRRLAITIAQVCQRPECESALLDLALDEREPAWRRDDGVWALREYGSLSTRKALLPLALQEIKDDEDDEIKGSALAAVFPDLASLEQVLPTLTQPRNDHLIGSYWRFMTRILPNELDQGELPLALEWAKGIVPTHRSHDVFNDLAEGVLGRAWPLVAEDEAIARLVADVVRVRLKAHQDLLDSIYQNEHSDAFRDAVGRHRLIEELIPDIREGELHAAAFKVSSPNLLLAQDLAWVLTRIEASLGTPEEAAWVQVARQTFETPISETDFDELERLCQKSKELDEALGDLFKTVRIDSPEADALRERFGHFRRPPKELPDRAQEMDEAIEEHLLAAEQGEDGAWWQLHYDLLFNEHGRSEPRLGEWEANLTALPGWKRSSAGVRERILHLARPALDGELPDPQDWFGGSSFNRGAFAGYRALYLLADLDRASFDALPSAIWESWMPIVIDFPSASRSEGENPHGLILRQAADLAGPTFAHWTKRKLMAEAAADEGNLFFLHALEGIESSEVTEKVVSLLADQKLRPNSLRGLLDYTLPRDPETSHALIAPRLAITEGEFKSDEAREAVVVCAAKLLTQVPGLAFSEVLALLDRSPELGKDVMLSVAREERSALTTDLADHELGDLVNWIFENFPEAEDPPLEEGWVSPRESLRDFRLWLLEALAERGTDLAVDLISAIYQKQGTTTLRFSLRKARDSRRAKSPAPSPGEVVQLVHGGGAAPRTQTDLLARVLAALGSIQSSLQVGQPPAAPELWNTRPTYTPKDEGDLTNWLSGRLSNVLGEGFDVSRERLISGGRVGRGKSTDMQVVCLSSSARRLQTLIEVKGCWEPKVSSKLQTQLADDYMAITGLETGVYVVFWFDPQKWDPSDNRRKGSTFTSAEEAQQALSAQAAQVSAERGVQIKAVVLDASLH